MKLQLQSPLYNKSSIIFTGIIIHILGLQRQYCTATVADKNVYKKKPDTDSESDMQWIHYCISKKFHALNLTINHLFIYQQPLFVMNKE